MSCTISSRDQEGVRCPSSQLVSFLHIEDVQGGIFSIIQQMMPELNRQQLASDGPLWAFHEQFISYSISKTGATFTPFRIMQTIFLLEDYKLHL